MKLKKIAKILQSELVETVDEQTYQYTAEIVGIDIIQKYGVRSALGKGKTRTEARKRLAKYLRGATCGESFYDDNKERQWNWTVIVTDNVSWK